MKEGKILKNQRVGELALHTAQWCNASIYQFKRFCALAFSPTDGKEPWDQNENSSMLYAERKFLVTAIYQEICYLDILQKEMQKEGDDSLKVILDDIATKDQREQIRRWRNTNEHERDYIQGIGTAQKKSNDPDLGLSGFFLGISDDVIYINGNTKEFYLGRISIDQLILRIKKNQPDILKRTKEIFYTYYYGIPLKNNQTISQEDHA